MRWGCEMNELKKVLLRSISEVHSGNREEAEKIVDRLFDCFGRCINLVESAIAERTRLLEEVLEFFDSCNSRDYYQVFDDQLIYDLNKKINKVLGNE